MKKKALVLALALCLVSAACTGDQILADINVMLAMASAVAPAVALISPPDAAAIGVLVNVATQGLNVVKTDYDQWKASGAQTDLEKVTAAINTADQNLAAELAAAHVVSPKAVTTVKAFAAVFSSTYKAILALLPQLTAQNSAIAKARVAASAPVPLTPAGLERRWNAEVCQGEAKCAKLIHKSKFNPRNW